MAVTNQRRNWYAASQRPEGLGSTTLGGASMYDFSSEDLSTQTEGSIMGGVATGAGYGASLAAINPILGAVGAAVGGIAGGIMAGSKNKEVRQHNRQVERNLTTLENEQRGRQSSAADRSLLRTFPTQGTGQAGLYALGGTIPQFDAMVEGDEVIQHDPNNVPVTDFNGSVTSLSSNMSQIEGDSHAAPSGGIKLDGGGRVFSDRLELTDDEIKNFYY